VAACGTTATEADKQSTPTTIRGEACKPEQAKTKPKAPPKGSITFKQYRQVQTGMSKSEVRALLGKPKDRDYTESKFMDETTKMETLELRQPWRRLGQPCSGRLATSRRSRGRSATAT